MRHLILPALLTLSLIATAALAQTQSPAPIVRPAPSSMEQATPQQAGPHLVRQHRAANPARTAARLGKRLNLSPDQTARLTPILAQRRQEIAALRQNTALAPRQRRQQLRSIRQESQAQLAAVLTPAELQQMHALHQAHAHHAIPQPQTAPASL